MADNHFIVRGPSPNPDALGLEATEELLESIAVRFSEPLRLNPVFNTKLEPLVEQVKQVRHG